MRGQRARVALSLQRGPEEGPGGVVGEESAGPRETTQGRAAGEAGQPGAGSSCLSCLTHQEMLGTHAAANRPPGPGPTGVGPAANRPAGHGALRRGGQGGLVEACVAGSTGSEGTWCPAFERGRERATPEPLAHKGTRKCQGWAVPEGLGPCRAARRASGGASASMEPSLLALARPLGPQGWPGRAGVRGRVGQRRRPVAAPQGVGFQV